MSRPHAAERNILLHCEIESADGELSCDRERILQVLSNLLNNAIKFSPARTEVWLRARLVPGLARFEVRDSGPGIERSELTHIFEAYWSAAKNAKKGTGLGLFISRGIVDAHGGTLDVESEPGRGSSFVVSLPT